MRIRKILVLLLAALMMFSTVVVFADDNTYITEQGGNENNHWSKDGDTWTYTFDVFDDEIPYYIWEDVLEGYMSEVMGSKDFFNENGEKTYTITNYSTELASLELKKIVNNSDTQQKFDFTITIDGWEGTFVRSGVVFENGVAHVKLGDTESIVISGLPAGKTYTVTEGEVAHFTVEKSNDTGTLAKGEDPIEVTFTNTYEPPTVEPQDVKLKKIVEGEFDDAGEFLFYISFEGLDANTEYNIENGDTFVSDNDGKANFEVNLANGQEIIFKSVPVGATYMITEAAGEYVSSYKINADNTVSSADETTSENIELSTAQETVDENETNEVVFTNIIHKTENLKIRKQVEGTAADLERSFSFQLELFNLEENTRINSSIGRLVADDEGYVLKEFTLKNGEEIYIEDLPVGTEYKVTELKNPLTANYLILDSNDTNNIENVAKSNTEKNQALATETERIDQGEDITVNFKNIRSNISLKVTKDVLGNMVDKTKEYTFTVKLNGTPNTYTLKQGESFEINDIPLNTNIEVIENDYSNEGYITYINGTTKSNTYIENNAEEDVEVTFQNCKDGAVPTEIRNMRLRNIALISVFCIGILLILKRKLSLTK